MSRKRGPLSIAMVVASPFPANHGTPGSIREMADAVAAKGHRVHVVTYHFGEGPLPRSARIHRVVDFGFSREVVVGPTWQRPILDFLMIITLCRVVYREKIDLIHAHNYEGALVGACASFVTRKPLIYNAINTMLDELPTYNFFKPKILAVWIARFLDFLVPRLAHRIIAISEDLAGFLAGKGIREEEISIIPLGIDLAPFQGVDSNLIRHKYHLEQKPLVMYTGILDSLQRIDYLLKAMRLVMERVEDARLLLVSTIAREKDLLDCRQMIQDLGLEDRVFLATGVPFREIPQFLAAADVTVVCRPACPGFPVKLLNYIAAGKPAVVFEGSAKNLKHMENAFVVPDHDWQGLGEGITTLLRNPALARQLGSNANEWVIENLSWPRITEKLETLYYELAKA